jgi:hypothetical protein
MKTIIGNVAVDWNKSASRSKQAKCKPHLGQGRVHAAKCPNQKGAPDDSLCN